MSVAECYRGRSVRVFRLDRAAVLARLRARAREILDRRPDVLEVRLFGSLARGEGRPGSDADLFVVVRDGAGPFLDRLPGLAREFQGIGIGCDVIAYTRSETDALRRRGGRFAGAVFEEGRCLAQREEDPPPGGSTDLTTAPDPAGPARRRACSP
jgi:predicted nucleotidyltransferase